MKNPLLFDERNCSAKLFIRFTQYLYWYNFPKCLKQAYKLVYISKKTASLFAFTMYLYHVYVWQKIMCTCTYIKFSFVRKRILFFYLQTKNNVLKVIRIYRDFKSDIISFTFSVVKWLLVQRLPISIYESYT